MIKIRTVTGGDISTNCYIIAEDKNCILIDFVPEVESKLDQLGLTVQAVFLTHIHFDHFQGLADFQKRNTFKLYLSETGKDNINNGQFTLTDTLPPMIAKKSVGVDISNAVALSDGETIELCGQQITAVYTPGHSLDSTTYVIETENVAFVGDTIFCQGVGRTDLFGGNTKQLHKSISKLFNILDDECVLYPGHGPATCVGDEQM